MAWQDNFISANDFDSIRLSVASEEDILNWSYGEVLKPETINYRTQKPERDGLFCERIFGPVKDINPNDPKLKGVRSREAAVDKEGNLVTKSITRRERMGHISLAAPVAHIWFMRGTPSALSLLLDITVTNIEKIVYFASYVVIDADKRRRHMVDTRPNIRTLHMHSRQRGRRILGHRRNNSCRTHFIYDERCSTQYRRNFKDNR